MSDAQGSVVVAEVEVPAVVVEVKKPRVQVSDEQFLIACHTHNSIESIAKALGQAESTVNQRRVELKKAGLKFPELPKGGGRKKKTRDVESLNAKIAAMMAERKAEAEAPQTGETEQAETPAAE